MPLSNLNLLFKILFHLLLHPAVFKKILLAFLAVLISWGAGAQTLSPNLDPSQQQQNLFEQGVDTNKIDPANDWDNTPPRIYYTTLGSTVQQIPDTSLGHFHRYRPQQTDWVKDLGNTGTAARKLLFDPALPIGLSLGYHIYDVYRLDISNVAFYNTTRPYSVFTGMIGSKAAQDVSVLHTQNISPNWNFAGKILYNSSPGFFAMQETGQTGGSFSTNYKSDDERYRLKLGFVYNRFKQEENGGLVSDSLLETTSDRMLIPVNLPATTPGGLVASTTNSLRDVDLLLEHHYVWGQRDTLYNADSTKLNYRFTPRFGLKHQMQIHSEKHIYKDIAPDSARYDFIAPITVGGSDSVYSAQNWFYFDNKFSLNGFIGKSESLAAVEAGIGIRIDRFRTDLGIEDQTSYAALSNYVFGKIQKEAIRKKQWAYGASAQFFFSGPAIGNFEVAGNLSKDFDRFGTLSVFLSQSLSNAPYAWENFSTAYYERHYEFGKINRTSLGANYTLSKYKLQLTAKNTLLSNYLYYNSSFQPVQESAPFSVLQLSARKEFHWKFLYLDNEIAWQQATGNAPVNLPALLLRHQLRAETDIFKNALRISVGLELRYHTPYYSDGYTPYFNQFYLQNDQEISSLPEVAAFFNFKVKRFRAFVLGEQVQQLISPNILNAPNYPAENFMFRFGFTWLMIN